jgi:hypothetical protein
MEPWNLDVCKTSFYTEGYAEIHIQMLFFDIKKAYEKFIYQKSKQCVHALVSLLHMEVFFLLKNTKISIFGGFQSFLN